MNFILEHILTIILFFPVLAAVAVLCLPKGALKAIRWTAFGLSLVPFLLTVVLWTQFKAGQPGFQFQEQAIWYAAIHSTFHIGVDGLSLTMLLLTTLLTPLALLASFNITDRLKAYMFLFLVLETGMLGVFLSLDLLIFFVFWEIGLVPMYFLINQWGSEKGERVLERCQSPVTQLCFLEIHHLHDGWFAGASACHPVVGSVVPELRSAGALPEVEFPDRWHFARPAGRDG